VPPDDYSFKAFSSHPFFRQVNTWLVDRAQLGGASRVVDVACGSGLVTELILERVSRAREALVVALDMSAAALRDARERVAGAAGVAIEFVQGKAEELREVVRGQVDSVVFCNGIHYVEDKRSVFHQIHDTLRPGGTFAFNTAFFEGAELPETLPFYRRWMIKSLRLLRARYDLSPDRTKVEARRQLTPAQYADALQSEGFEIQIQELLPATLPEQGWIDIARYADFAQGTLPGIPLAQATEVLCDAIRETFAELGLTGVARNWLSVVAARA
jgi:ubiquinone/menaquinone biosynthesis C-methylase UbiE